MNGSHRSKPAKAELRIADVRIDLGDWERLRAEAVPIRRAVFVDEQKVPSDLEIDDWDLRSLHALARDRSGRALGTARLLPDGHIGRIAVLREARGAGVGTALVEAMLQVAHTRGLGEAVLSAQTHALAFYRRLGFTEEGEPYDDAGIPHITMRRRL